MCALPVEIVSVRHLSLAFEAERSGEDLEKFELRHRGAVTEDITCVPGLGEDVEESGGDKFVQIVHTNGSGSFSGGCCTEILFHALLAKKAHNVIVLEDETCVSMLLQSCQR